jgi:hypothetical protein
MSSASVIDFLGPCSIFELPLVSTPAMPRSGRRRASNSRRPMTETPLPARPLTRLPDVGPSDVAATAAAIAATRRRHSAGRHRRAKRGSHPTSSGNTRTVTPTKRPVAAPERPDGMSSTPWGTSRQVDGGRESSSRERARTAAAMRSTVEQLRRAARILGSSAAASRDPRTARRLGALGIAVSAQADDIQRRADRLTHDWPGAPGAGTGQNDG